MRRRGIGRDEAFQRKVAGIPPVGGVVLGEERPAPPAVTSEEWFLQSNQLLLVRVTDDEENVAGWQLRFIDPFRHRTIIFPMSPEQFEALYGDIGDALNPPEVETPPAEDTPGGDV